MQHRDRPERAVSRGRVLSDVLGVQDARCRRRPQGPRPASDNCAANLLLRELGGPTAITRFCRSIGDRTTRLDRWEPELNSAEPGRVTDTSSPSAVGRTYAKLALGDGRTPRDRRQLTAWLLANTTSTNRFRAGLPEDWALGDKTGTGKYGATNDAGIAWIPDGAPVVLAVLSTMPDTEPDTPMDEPLVAKTAALLAKALVAVARRANRTGFRPCPWAYAGAPPGPSACRGADNRPSPRWC